MPFLVFRRRAVLAALLAAFSGSAMTAEPDPHAARRRVMVDEIARMARDTAGETGRGNFSAAVMNAIGTVPRHCFVPPAELDSAYENRPLAIGAGQTISQPYIVALMTELLDVQPTDSVLEIGTGSGYQTAVLSVLAHAVFTVEIVESLAREAASRLAGLGYRNVTGHVGDGHLGWPGSPAFDAIIVTAAARELPGALLEQLKPGGRLVIPIGAPDGAQTLYSYAKDQHGNVAHRAVLAVRFVPMTGGPR